MIDRPLPAQVRPHALAPLRDLTYSGAPLDRDETLRTDAAALARLSRDPDSLTVPIWRNAVLVSRGHGGDGPRALTLAGDWVPGDPALAPRERAFLGRDGEGRAWFAIQLPPDRGGENGPDLRPDGRFVPLRSVGSSLPADQAAILAQAVGVLAWHRRHRFCPSCGAPSQADQGGWRRRCTGPDCGAAQFPRTDPAVIMLVHHGRGETARCLLGRGARLPAGMVSTLAGFVEPGETLEEAVRREVMEETGIRVGRVAYAGSQPWPFPGSVMLGFHAEADSTDITLDPRELEFAAWFSRHQVAAFAPQSGSWQDGDPWRLPRGDSIARRLIAGWLTGDVFAPKGEDARGHAPEG